jgi:hypothetical protein
VLRGALADLPPTAEPTPLRGEIQAALTRNHCSIGLRWLARDRHKAQISPPHAIRSVGRELPAKMGTALTEEQEARLKERW